MKNENAVWVTEEGDRIALKNMTMGHLRAAIDFVNGKIRQRERDIKMLELPLPHGMQLTDDAINDIYIQKSKLIAIKRIRVKLMTEVSRRQIMMNEGFSYVIGNPAASLKK